MPAGHDSQDAPNASQTVRYVRVIRARHPLAGQVVKVLRQTRHAGHDEPCWVVQPPGRSPVSLPLGWAVLVDDTTDAAPGPIEPADDGPRVDVTSLRNLATMVGRLRATLSPEVADHDPPAPSVARRMRPATGLHGEQNRSAKARRRRRRSPCSTTPDSPNNDVLPNPILFPMTNASWACSAASQSRS